MSLDHAFTIAQELAALTESAIASGVGDAAAMAAILDRREAIIWRLSDACTAATLTAAPPAERRRLIEVLRGAELATRAMLEAASSDREATLASLTQVRPVQVTETRTEPRFTECAA